MSREFDVLIIGGGVVGLTAALAMALRNYSVGLIDAGTLMVDEAAADLRVYAINKASQNLLGQLDVWQRIDSAHLSTYNKMYVWDGVNGAHIDFDSRVIAAQSLGTILAESALKKALIDQIVEKEQITLFPNSIVDEIEILDKGVRIKGKEGYWESRLLMIADGANSPARKKLNVPMTTWSYNQQAIIATVTTEKPHCHTAYQVFHPDGPLALLPLISTNQCSIVWSTTPARAQHLMTIDPDTFNTEITKAFAQHLGAVTLASERHYFPLHMRHVQKYVGKHWLLLGDAAHTIHPLAGLGLNVGLTDVTCWLGHLDKSKGTLNNSRLLGAYQRERKAAVWQTILLMEGFKHLFGYSQNTVTTIRGLGLRLCNGIPYLKRLFIQHASG